MVNLMSLDPSNASLLAYTEFEDNDWPRGDKVEREPLQVRRLAASSVCLTRAGLAGNRLAWRISPEDLEHHDGIPQNCVLRARPWGDFSHNCTSESARNPAQRPGTPYGLH
jgi:hypothetical protein